MVYNYLYLNSADSGECLAGIQVANGPGIGYEAGITILQFGLGYAGRSFCYSVPAGFSYVGYRGSGADLLIRSHDASHCIIIGLGSRLADAPIRQYLGILPPCLYSHYLGYAGPVGRTYFTRLPPL